MGRRRRRPRKVKARAAAEDPFTIPGWVEYGGRLIFAVDFTSGGAPIGLEANELEEETFETREDDPFTGTVATNESPNDA